MNTFEALKERKLVPRQLMPKDAHAQVGGNEKFEATSPTGTKYTFDKVIIREAKVLEFFDHDSDDINLDR